MATASLQAAMMAVGSLTSNLPTHLTLTHQFSSSFQPVVKLSQSSCKINAREPEKTFRRNSSVTCSSSVSTTETDTETAAPEVTIEDRKMAVESTAGKKTFKLSEVDAAAKQDFYVSEVLEVREVAEGVRCITVETEISREFIDLSKAYCTPGQKVEIRLSENSESTLIPVSSAPFPSETNRAVLLKLRGDIPAGSTKMASYGVSVRAPLDLHVSEASAPELYDLQPGAQLEVGPFQKGVDLRPIMFLARFPIVLIFASGEGIAPARALIEAEDVGSLFLKMREDVRCFYSAPSPSEIAYKDLFQTWEEKNVKIRPTVDSTSGNSWEGFVGSFQELFDDDDLEYDPESTAAIVFGSKDKNDEVMKLLEEAGLPEKAILRWDV